MRWIVGIAGLLLIALAGFMLLHGFHAYYGADGSEYRTYPLKTGALSFIVGLFLIIGAVFDLDFRKADAETQDTIDRIPYTHPKPDTGQKETHRGQTLRVDKDASIEAKMRARAARVAKARSEGKL